MRNWIRLKLLAFLGLPRIDERLVAVEQHFVITHDPKTGAVVETLADKQAAKDGRPAPKPLRPSKQWSQQRRVLEFNDDRRAQSILHGKKAN